MRRAFTLMEMLISIFILSLVLAYLYESIDSLKFTNNFYEEKSKKLKQFQKMALVLKNDLFMAKDIKFLDKDSKDYTILKIDHTRNSLYDISAPCVVWFVLKKEDTLVRFESAKDIKFPPPYDDIQKIHKDIVAKECKTFKLYRSSDKKSILAYIKIGSSKPIVFETSIY